MIAVRLYKEEGTSSIKRLIEYLENPQGKEERVGEVSFSNVLCEGHEFILKEILNTQERNTRAKSDKTYHLMVSFREGERPSLEVLKELETKFAEALGYQDHQRSFVLHKDTDNLHFHMAINKIHPEKFTIHEPYYDQIALGKLCEKLEQEYHLQEDNHIPSNSKSQNAAARMEHAGGMESLLGWIQRNCGEELKEAKSWESLHNILNKHGLEIIEKGRGLIITNGTHAVKASSIDRNLSKYRLTEKLGKFKEHLDIKKPTTTYKVKPLDTTMSSKTLWEAFQKENEQTYNNKKEILGTARKEKYESIKATRKKQQKQKKIVYLFTRSQFLRKFFKHFFDKIAENEIANAKQKYQTLKEQTLTKTLRWNDWLKKEAQAGNKNALDYLQSRRTKSPQGNIFAGKTKKENNSTGINEDSISRKGTKIFSGGIRETKACVQIDNETTDIYKSLLIAKEKFNGKFSVNGTPAFEKQVLACAVKNKMEVTFINESMEIQRQKLLSKQNHLEAVQKYIDKRNILSETYSDIMKHDIFIATDEGIKIYAGIRKQDSYNMALIEEAQKIIVLPISHQTAQKMKSIKIGTEINLTKTGTITPKARIAKR